MNDDDDDLILTCNQGYTGDNYRIAQLPFLQMACSEDYFYTMNRVKPYPVYFLLTPKTLPPNLGQGREGWNHALEFLRRRVG